MRQNGLFEPEAPEVTEIVLENLKRFPRSAAYCLRGLYDEQKSHRLQRRFDPGIKLLILYLCAFASLREIFFRSLSSFAAT
jgi:hypothetical protein